MKQVIATRFVDIPDDVEFEVRARKVKVKGPRGERYCHCTVHRYVVQCLLSKVRHTMLRGTSATQQPRGEKASGLGCWPTADVSFNEPMRAGSLVREFKHLAVDMFVIEEDGQKKLQVEAHFGKRKALASIRTVCSHVQVSRHCLVKAFPSCSAVMACQVNTSQHR